MPEPTLSDEQQQAFAQFAEYGDDVPLVLPNKNMIPEVAESTTKQSWLRKMLLAVPLLFAMFCFWQALPDRVTSLQTAQAVTASSEPQRQLKTVPIKDIRLGQRTIGVNPDREDTHPDQREPVAATWREIHLELAKADQSIVQVELLRPHSWLEYHNAKAGSVIYLDLPEMGAQGFADVIDILPCPEIEPDTCTHRNVVTGRFIHEPDGNLVDLKIEGQIESTTVTSNHAYWSADRQEFIEVGHLQNGEQVQTVNGLAKVASITPHAGNETVYNLEIHGEHVYRVGSLGVLVHNDCLDYAKNLLRQRSQGAIIRMLPKGTRFTGKLPNYPVRGKYGLGAREGGDKHYFHLENGILRDPAHPRGIPIDDWIKKYADLNEMSTDQVMNWVGFLPYLK
ncbi:MAG: hypothetical protein JKY95_10310 [Planctomycetaceae bacterium]|nr:hypothetical protein [Planctomycetaceae bacterium]